MSPECTKLHRFAPIFSKNFGSIPLDSQPPQTRQSSLWARAHRPLFQELRRSLTDYDGWWTCRYLNKPSMVQFKTVIFGSSKDSDEHKAKLVNPIYENPGYIDVDDEEVYMKGYRPNLLRQSSSPSCNLHLFWISWQKKTIISSRCI